MKRDGFEGELVHILTQQIRQEQLKDPLSSLIYVSDCGYYPNAVGHFRHREEGAEEHILIYCVQGEGSYTIDGNSHEIAKDDFFIIEAGKAHSYAAHKSNPWSIYWIHFGGEKANLFSSIFNTTIHISNAPTERKKERIELFKEIIINLEASHNPEALNYCSISLWYLLGSLKYIKQYRMIKRPKSSDPIEQAIELMRKNIDKQLTTDDIAAHVRYSTSHFGSKFLSKTGYTPIGYFNYLKIQDACKYLNYTELNIKEIAFKLGFSDQYYFSKVFKKIMGITPSKYKKKA